jgi:hypothetical protein
MRSIENRLQKLEGAHGAEAPACSHKIPIINEGEPTPESSCDCGRTHFVIVVCYRSPAPAAEEGGRPGDEHPEQGRKA